ncbi:hypothetical protein SLA2020_432210 [Shorea laevis]
MDFLLIAIAIDLPVAYSGWFKNLLHLAFNHWSEELGHRRKLMVKLFVWPSCTWTCAQVLSREDPSFHSDMLRIGS